ncbi:hypothetical protein QBC33DRAFT_553203 [Phialemonium atrogriseum]|uniref:Uncharacterized protein n=1 Tax=Phialemonium atrogriseum TaxID=1093897 RepID=A0AAJ0BP86_9PEZI|nr:uncharacterized protein QBC33DRAFT_553203 [Phialemonium atrogriseum]KAK1761948.1 hypothetical protein QBC33DRAFT_553203 [Phialemonium atrogriseum]
MANPKPPQRDTLRTLLFRYTQEDTRDNVIALKDLDSHQFGTLQDSPRWPPLPSPSPLSRSDLLNRANPTHQSATQPPATSGLFSRPHPWTALEWAGFFDSAVYCFTQAAEESRQGRWAARAPFGIDSPFDEYIQTGERLEEGYERGETSRLRWKALSQLELDAASVGCVIADSTADMVAKGCILRSELVCALALACRQIWERKADDLGPGRTLTITTATFTKDSARIVYMLIPLTGEQQPPISIVVQRDEPLGKMVSTTEEAVEKWQDILRHMFFGKSALLSPPKLRIPSSRKEQREQILSSGTGRNVVVSRTTSERLFSGSTDPPKNDGRGSESSSSSSSVFDGR